MCANVVCATDGVAGAVLLRAAAVEAGIDVAQARRGDSTRPAALARGPGNLCSALGITMDDNGIDLFDAKSPVRADARRRSTSVSMARGSASARLRTGPGGSGWPVARRCRCIAVVRGHLLPAKATDPSPQSAVLSMRNAGGAEAGAPRPAALVGEIYTCDDLACVAGAGRRLSGFEVGEHEFRTGGTCREVQMPSRRRPRSGCPRRRCTGVAAHQLAWLLAVPECRRGSLSYVLVAVTATRPGR